MLYHIDMHILRQGTPVGQETLTRTTDALFTIIAFFSELVLVCLRAHSIGHCPANNFVYI